GRGDRSISRDDDYLDIGIKLPGPLEHLDAIHRLHSDVRKHQVELFLFKLPESSEAVMNAYRLIALPSQYMLEVFPGYLLVIDYQDARSTHQASFFWLTVSIGKRIVNRVPSFSRLSTEI